VRSEKLFGNDEEAVSVQLYALSCHMHGRTWEKLREASIRIADVST
jgi:hypothetical protein